MPLPDDYHPRRDLEDLERREAEEQRFLENWELRRYEPNEGFGAIYRASEEGDDGLV